MCVSIIFFSQGSWAYISYISNIILYERGEDHVALQKKIRWKECRTEGILNHRGRKDNGDHPIQPLNYYSNEETQAG